MKVKDLFEQQKAIEKDVIVPTRTTKLNYAGATVNGAFNCVETKITSLVGSPSKVMKAFYCSHTKITSLEGAPEYVGGNFDCANTLIKSLHNIHKITKYIGGDLYLPETIESNVIGVMFIKGLKKIEFIPPEDVNLNKVSKIINKHIQGDQDPHACQVELFEAGLSAYAKL